MDRLHKAGNFLSSQQKQSRYHMCLKEGRSSATYNTPVGMAGKVYRALPQAMADETLTADPFAVTYKKCDHFLTLQVTPIILYAHRI